jgi:hypothetical protein
LQNAVAAATRRDYLPRTVVEIQHLNGKQSIAQ